jgi:hypothetical protein
MCLRASSVSNLVLVCISRPYTLEYAGNLANLYGLLGRRDEAAALDKHIASHKKTICHDL